MKSWLTSFEKANTFSWVSLKSYVTWPELEESGTCVNDEVPNTVLMDELFDVKALLAEFLGKLEKKNCQLQKSGHLNLMSAYSGKQMFHAQTFQKSWSLQCAF